MWQCSLAMGSQNTLFLNLKAFAKVLSLETITILTKVGVGLECSGKIKEPGVLLHPMT